MTRPPSRSRAPTPRPPSRSRAPTTRPPSRSRTTPTRPPSRSRAPTARPPSRSWTSPTRPAPPRRHGRSPPDLPDDLIPEILLRASPQTPALLIRCSAVCKAWRRLLTSAPFLHRYRAFHGAAPLLGFIFNRSLPPPRDLVVPEFVRVTPFRPSARIRDRLDWVAHDARHGRVLLHVCVLNCIGREMALVVWDPVTGEQHEMPMPEVDFGDWDATVLCAAHLRGCDHLHCHRGGPFLVAFIGSNGGDAWACVYSSEAGAWADAITADIPDYADNDMAMSPTALVGNTVYFLSARGGTLVEYDLAHQKLAFIATPCMGAVVTPWEGGQLGFATVQGTSLHMWSRDVRPGGNAVWMERRVIELNTLPILEHCRYQAAGYAEGLGEFFVSTDAGVFAINLKSGRVKKVFDRKCHTIIPYTSFYTPDQAAG